MTLFCGFFLPTTNSVIKQESLVYVTLSLPCLHGNYSKNVPAAICDSLVLLVIEVSGGLVCDRQVKRARGKFQNPRAAATGSLAQMKGIHQSDHSNRFTRPWGTFGPVPLVIGSLRGLRPLFVLVCLHLDRGARV